MASSDIDIDDDAMRAHLRATFTASVSNGSRMPLVIPYSLLGAFIVPTLWLSLSQKRHPWVYHTRWLVAAFIIIFNLRVAGRTSSSNLAVSYATGLLCGWGIIYNLNLLVWTRPQVTAARIVRRKKELMSEGGKKEPFQTEHTSSTSEAPTEHLNGPHIASASTIRQRAASSELKNGVQDIKSNGYHDKPTQDELVWQPFPHNAPWKERLNWAFDLTTSFRGCGKFSQTKRCALPLYDCRAWD